MTEAIKLGIKSVLEQRKEYDALNYINELEKENAELEEIRGQQARIINNDTIRIERLKVQIEEMKKGYECCNEYEKCLIKNTDCIVFSKKGKEKYKQFIKNQKEGVLDD